MSYTRIQKAILYFILILLAAVCLYPFIIMFFGSFKESSMGMIEKMFWWPGNPSLANYISNLKQELVLRWFVNSIVISIVPVVTNTFLCILLGFIFAKKKFYGKNVIFGLLMASVIVPYQITLIPNFIMLSWFDWINTYLPFLIPQMYTVMFIFLARQFISTVPDALLDAAYIDGCGDWKIFIHAILPLSKQIIITITIFVFMYRWNDFMTPLIFVTSDTMYNLVVGLASILRQTPDFGIQMAAGMINFIPMFIVYMFGQKYFTRGVIVSGMK